MTCRLRRGWTRLRARSARRRAGVRGLALPRHEVALDAERAEDDAERETHRLQHRPLLDVQLEVGGRALHLLARRERIVEVDAVLCERVRQCDAIRIPSLAE